MKIGTIGELIYWSYANLGMAHAAVEDKAEAYGRKHYIIRNRLWSGLRRSSMQVASLLHDERLKMILPQSCCYCGSTKALSVDHLIARSKGGQDDGENIVWACRHCNSSKGDKDLLAWMSERTEFPPLLLLRRYLKLVLRICTDRGILDESISSNIDVPFSMQAIPVDFPGPALLRLWVPPME